MISASEFTIGSIGQAVPLSLMLPRHSREETILMARSPNGPAAYFLSERERFKWFESDGNEHWHGLIVPNVRIEIDESSVFDPNRDGYKLGTVIRSGTQLLAQARRNSFPSFNGLGPIILEDDLLPTSNEVAGFYRWQVVLWRSEEKHILHTVSVE